MDVPILMYHSVTDNAAPNYRTWTVSPQQFATQMQYLHQHNYTPITVAQFATAMPNKPLPAKPVVITFDDGFADFYTHAWPVLQQYGFVASMYVATGAIECNDVAAGAMAPIAYMTWAQLAEIHTAGIEIAAHTHTHAKLDAMPLAQAKWEISHSKALIESKLGAPVTTFAYPYGRYNADIYTEMAQAGYAAACAVRYEMSAPSDQRFALARIIVQPDHTLADFAALLTRQGVVRKLAIHRLKARVWRMFLALSHT